MKILFLNPFNPGEELPRDVPFEILRLTAIADSAGHKLDVMDLNAYREMNTNEAILDGMKYEKELVDYDLVWVVSSFSAFAQAKRVIGLIHGKLPESVMVLAGSAATALPRKVFGLLEGLDVAVFGDQEETFLEVVERVPGQRWDPVKGIAFRTEHGIRQNPPRPLIAELDGVPFPKYRFGAMDRYFQFSSLPICFEALGSKRRLSFSWERRHIDETGKEAVRLPSPKRAVENIVAARFRYAIDFATLVDHGIMRTGWFKEFIDAYMVEELHEIVPWSCWGDPAFIVRNPDFVRSLKDANCKAVLMETSKSAGALATPIELLREAGINPVLRYVVGAPDQTFGDVAGMSYLSFSSKVEPYEVLAPNLYPDGPYYDAHKGEILEPYGGDLEGFLSDASRTSPVNWLGGFSFPDVVTLRTLVRTNDFGSLLRFAHARNMSHSSEWAPHCPVCKQVSKEAVQVAVTGAASP